MILWMHKLNLSPPLGPLFSRPTALFIRRKKQLTGLDWAVKNYNNNEEKEKRKWKEKEKCQEWSHLMLKCKKRPKMQSIVAVVKSLKTNILCPWCFYKIMICNSNTDNFLSVHWVALQSLQLHTGLTVQYSTVTLPRFKMEDKPTFYC